MIFVVSWISFHKLGRPCFEPRQFDLFIWTSSILIFEKWMWTFYPWNFFIYYMFDELLINYALIFLLLHICIWGRGCHRVYLINRLPYTSIQDKVPFLKPFHKIPDYSFLRIFGCACFPLLRPYNSHKLQYKSGVCLLRLLQFTQRL